ncbi:hypothetical protein N5079_32180 [Planotetraspora sp. A-T 1434]|uniref:hypothetical protein n=1 Tax=Planotetraspora sp. A-T 1434 TaxID=2979219 RepID=UPI0021BF04C3|nr:hypothetical protein [Planotetraspora sp. A-T 1434]MCT9934875.1 hypothetical protein [Planotetraspora sp. A-T 1434]
MSIMTAYAQAEAVRAGRAQPIASVRHAHLSTRPLVFIPLKMAGEAAAPLGAMVGTHRDDPHLLVVPQPRDRSLRFAFVTELAEVMVPYIESFQRASETVGTREPYERFLDAPQILVPNRGGIGFTRLLGRSSRFRSADGPYPVHPSVPVLGRWLTFLAERTEFAGASTLLAMTELLALHWATGQSGTEDGALAALLAWIAPPEGMTALEAAARAENPLLTPPAGPATDPGFDAGVLQPGIEAYDSTGSPAQVRGAIKSQLEPTWQLMWEAVDVLRGLPEGASVADRWARDRDDFSRYTAHLATGGAPQPRLDSAVAAAMRLERLEDAQARYDAQRAFDDPLVLAEYRLTGTTFAGRVIAADPTRIVTGRRRVLRPLITVQTSDPVRLAPGQVLRSPARPGQKAEITELAAGRIVLELSGGMGNSLTPRPGSVPEIGEWLTYTDLEVPSPRKRPPFPSRENTPWTHGGPPPEYIPTDEDAQEAWS